MAQKGGDDSGVRSTMRMLIMFVARAFYDTRFVVVLDQLAKHEVLKDDELASRVGLNNKDCSKLTTKLVSDGLVSVYRQNISRTGETMSRVTSKGYYYIDYANFCNVVKWRVSKMRDLIDDKLRNELAQQGYVCPQCKKTVEPLQIAPYLRGDAFFCDDCNVELVDNASKDDESGKADRLQRFNKQTESIRERLKSTEEMVMPKIDVLDWIKRHPTITTTVDGEPVQDDGLAIAGSKPGVTQKQVYEVVLTADDKEERERRRAKELEASKRKEQNALPSWHTHSTVSGAMTAFGMQNTTKPAGAGPVAVISRPELENDQKNGIAEWYAKLDAEGPQTSEANGETPMDIESLYAPPRLHNSYSSSSLKRKLVVENGDVSMRSRKHSRSTSYQSSPASDTMAVRSRDSVHSSSHTSPTSSTAGWTASQQSTGAAGGGDPKDPVVYVDGVAVAYSRVTEEHHDSMTPEEYQRYMDLYLLLGESG